MWWPWCTRSQPLSPPRSGPCPRSRTSERCASRLPSSPPSHRLRSQGHNPQGGNQGADDWEVGKKGNTSRWWWGGVSVIVKPKLPSDYGPLIWRPQSGNIFPIGRLSGRSVSVDLEPFDACDHQLGLSDRTVWPDFGRWEMQDRLMHEKLFALSDQTAETEFRGP